MLSGPIICGIKDGKVKALQIKTNKSHSLYSSGSMVLSISSNSRGTGFVTGHIDGTIIRYYLDEENSEYPVAKLTVHPVPPNILIWAQNFVFTVGCDNRLIIYNEEGKVIKKFDYTNQDAFTIGCSNPGGHVSIEMD